MMAIPGWRCSRRPGAQQEHAVGADAGVRDFSLITVLWVVYGYKPGFTEARLRRRFGPDVPEGRVRPATGAFAMGATFQQGRGHPEIVFVAFQATFAAITAGSSLGAFGERHEILGLLLFMALWFTRTHTVAHMVWYHGMGPTPHRASVVGRDNARPAWLWQWGALDFAGGTRCTSTLPSRDRGA